MLLGSLLALMGTSALTQRPSATPGTGPQAAAVNNPTTEPVLLVLGDSLSAEYGLARGSGWVALLSDRLAREKFPHRVVNASISGETTAGGRSQLPALLARHRPAVVIIELGGNDALRGLSLQLTEDNLDFMVRASLEAGARVLLVGIEVPPNYGKAFVERFVSVFPRVAQRHRVPLVPMLLAGFGEDLSWFQADRIHPNEQAQPRMLATVWPALEPLLGRRRGG